MTDKTDSRETLAKRQLVNLEKMDRALWCRSVEAGTPFGSQTDWLLPGTVYKLQDIAEGRSK